MKDISVLRREVVCFAVKQKGVRAVRKDYLVTDKEGKKTSDDKALERLQNKHPVVELMRKYRSAFKLYTSYIVGLWNALDGDRLHTSYLVHGTRTGRLSSSSMMHLST